MWQEQISSPFDCAVCGGGVYGSNSGIRICLLCKSFFKRHVFLPADVSFREKKYFFSNSFLFILDIKM